MKKWHKLLVFIGLIAATACTEDIVIDIEEGDPMIGVEAYFTTELKQHETILSYTADFYNKSDIQMISGATVYVTDGIDTIPYIEKPDCPGHYLTDVVAGKKNTLYRLCIDIPEADGEVTHLFSERLIPDNAERLDSIVVKPFSGMDDTIPSVIFNDTIEYLYPYFLCPEDPSLVFMPMVYKNDTLLTDSLTQQAPIPVGGYAGYYINGPEMQMANKEIPVYFFRYPRNLRDGDRIRLDVRSIQADYLMFYYSIVMSAGSNPMLGAPANVNTNIQPADKAVGWFFTASSISAETTFFNTLSNSTPARR